MRKPMLSADQLIDHLQSRGVRFVRMGEEAARRLLRTNNIYFKLTSFCDNYPRRDGQYVGLDFADLVDLMRLDLEVRNLLLDVALDVEHALKVALIAAVDARRADGQEDGYRIIRDFLLDEGNASMLDRAANIDYRMGNFVKKVRQNRKNPYCDGLIAQYEDEMPIWAYLELVTFSEIQQLAEYFRQRTGWQPPMDMDSLDRVRQIRNACAHGNCVLNDFRPTGGQHNTPPHIRRFLEGAGLSADASAPMMANPRIQQLVHTLQVFDALVEDEYVRELRRSELHRMMTERIPRRCRALAANPLLRQVYEFFLPLVQRL